MAYAADGDVVLVLPAYLRLQLFDDSGTGVETAGVVAALLQAASDEVDTYLSTIYGAPLTGMDITGGVKGETLRVFRYMAHRRKGVVDEQVLRDYEMALASLKAMADGALGTGSSDRPDSRTALLNVEMTSATRVFGRANLSGY